MLNNNYGGVELKNVIDFFLKISFGQQYALLKSDDEKDIIVACLRLGWKEAFKHVSENHNEKGINEEDLRKFLKKVCFKNFIEYCKCSATEDKSKIIESILKDDHDFYKGIIDFKKISDTKNPICFGHIQKMFNLAIKFYLCLVILKDSGLFDKKLNIDIDFEHADCPIDSKILMKIKDNTINDLSWSKIKTDEDIRKYKKIQEYISEEVKGNSNLSFDFNEW